MSPCEVFSSLSNQVRIQILGILSGGERNVTEIARGLKLSQTHVSHNLRKLTGAKLVRMRREGQFRYYALNADTQTLMRLASVMHPVAVSGIFCQDRLPFSFVVTDAEGTYLMLGGDILRRYEMTEAECVGKSVFDLHSHDENICQHMRRALAGHELTWKAWTRAGVFDVRTIPLKCEQGNVTGTVSFIFDAAPRDLSAKIFVYLRPCPCESGKESWQCCLRDESMAIWEEFCPCGSSRVIRECCMRAAEQSKPA